MRRACAIVLAMAGLASASAFADSLDLVISGGAATGYIQQQFSQSGKDTAFVYFAPGGYVDAEFDWNGFFMDIPLSFLFSPFTVSLGGQAVDVSGYTANNAADFALNIGYLFPVMTGLSVGGAVGLHVSGPWLEAPNNDQTRLNLIDYGLVGVNLLARVRYSFAGSWSVTLTVPVGIDLTYMNPDVVVAGQDTGVTIPATIYPTSLTPKNTGMTYGLTLAVGYAIPLGDM